MLNKATTNETRKPTARKPIWPVVKVDALLIISSPVAAAIVGMAKRKENSTIVFRFKPRDKPPMIVAADRETPGIMATDWNNPMTIACW